MTRRFCLDRFRWLPFILLFFAGTLPLHAAEPTPSATQPSAEMTALLKKIDAEYAQLQSAEFDGRVIAHFDVAGQQKNEEISFTSSFRSPNLFKHEAKGDLQLGCTGQTAYAFLPSRNVYISADAPKERAGLSDWPRVIAQVLQQQNPSLLLALTPSATGGLKDLGQEMILLPDTKLDGRPFPTVQFELPQHQVITMLIDPKTSLLRQVRFDLRKSLEGRGATDVKTAEVTVDYTTVMTGTPIDEKTFAWAPPAGSMLATAAPTTPDDDEQAALALIGKPAPDFTLSGLDDKPITLSALKGSVVVLDFWATWCGPCVMAIPDTDQLYKDQSPNGLKVFAVNLQDDKDVVKAFVEQRKLSLPILLDVQGDVGKQYMAPPIPEVFVIGKDGIVKKVFIGVNEETAEQIKSAVVKEMGS